MIDPARDKAVWAVLIDKFQLRPWEISKLTDRQIHELYFHPRDQHGAIIFPSLPVPEALKKPATLEDDLNSLRAMRQYMKQSDYEAAIKRLKEIHGRQPDPEGS